MKTVQKNEAEAMMCLGNKLEVVASDPDPNAMDKMTEEFNCDNCITSSFCHNLFEFVAK